MGGRRFLGMEHSEEAAVRSEESRAGFCVGRGGAAVEGEEEGADTWAEATAAAVRVRPELLATGGVAAVVGHVHRRRRRWFEPDECEEGLFAGDFFRSIVFLVWLFGFG